MIIDKNRVIKAKKRVFQVIVKGSAISIIEDCYAEGIISKTQKVQIDKLIKKKYGKK